MHSAEYSGATHCRQREAHLGITKFHSHLLTSKVRTEVTVGPRVGGGQHLNLVASLESVGLRAGLSSRHMAGTGCRMEPGAVSKLPPNRAVGWLEGESLPRW